VWHPSEARLPPSVGRTRSVGPSSVRATAETLRFAAGYVDVKPLGPVAVKGLSTAVAVGELLGVVPI
jgi:hypothetical protein